MIEMKKLANEAAERYNRYRFPEATVKVLNTTDNSIEVLFEGPFVNSCCFYDWIDDYKIELMDLSGIKFEILDIEQIDIEKFKVKFKANITR